MTRQILALKLRRDPILNDIDRSMVRMLHVYYKIVINYLVLLLFFDNVWIIQMIYEMHNLEYEI